MYYWVSCAVPGCPPMACGAAVPPGAASVGAAAGPLLHIIIIINYMFIITITIDHYQTDKCFY